MVSKQVSQQLEKGIKTSDVKVSFGLIELIGLILSCKMDLGVVQYLCHQNKIILNGFKAASITEAVGSANTVLERIENSFNEQ